MLLGAPRAQGYTHARERVAAGHARSKGQVALRMLMRLCIIWLMTDLSLVVRALDEAGYRLTSPRRALASIVAGIDGPFTAARVVDEVRERGLHVGRATVFRTIDALERAGAIERIDLPSGDHAYVGCAPAHHHHVVCSACGRTAEVADGDLAALIGRIGRRTGYRIEDHRLEIFGLCPTCVATAMDEAR